MRPIACVPVTILLLVAGVKMSAFAGESEGPMVDMYRRGDGRDAIACRSIEPRDICGSSDLGSEIMYSDCTDGEFDCIVSTADVFAVPKAGLTLGQEYTAFGAKLKVQRCFGDEVSCEIAMISSKCATPEICHCRSPSFPRTTTFYYSRARGVTAFYTIRDDLGEMGIDPEMVRDGVPLITYVLVASEGFLRAALSLPRAELMTCLK